MNIPFPADVPSNAIQLQQKLACIVIFGFIGESLNTQMQIYLRLSCN